VRQNVEQRICVFGIEEHLADPAIWIKAYRHLIFQIVAFESDVLRRSPVWQTVAPWCVAPGRTLPYVHFADPELLIPKQRNPAVTGWVFRLCGPWLFGAAGRKHPIDRRRERLLRR
jgi:hypothetical protein